MGACFSSSSAGGAGGKSSTPRIEPVNKDIPLQRSILGGANPTDVTEFYELGKVLGAGQYGTTRLCKHKPSGQAFACKSIMKTRLSPLEESLVKQEVQIMHHTAGGRNVVMLKEAFEDHVYVHLIMELCEGGDLVDRIIAKGAYTEADAARIMRTMLKTIAYCHQLGVAHRDLKPDNFLLATKDCDLGPEIDGALKAADFGLSAFFKPGEPMTDVVGTAYYLAPEVLMGEYDHRADVWALGVILYILLSGRPPFDAPRDEDIFRQIVDGGQPDFSARAWLGISEPAKDCVRRLMTFNYKVRPTARQMLEHEWVREGGVAGDTVVQPEVLQRLRSFAAMNKLKKQALLVIASRLSADEIRGLRELFTAMDQDRSGTISVDELRRGLELMGGSLPQAEVLELMASADVNANNELDIDEFIGATMHFCKLQREENLLAAFKSFDADADGFITRDELRAALDAQAASAQQLDLDIAAVLRDSDTDQDDRISYLEFCAMLLPPERASTLPCGAAKFAANCRAAAPGGGAAAGGRAETAQLADQRA